MTSPANAPPSRLKLVPAPAPNASIKPRHRGIVATFFAVVITPLIVIGAYLHFQAADQFGSHAGFSVRTESAPTPIELFGGLADYAGSGSQDASILAAFIQSQDIVESLEAKLNLTELFSSAENDPVFAHHADSNIEELHAYWERMVRVSHDTSTGLLDLHVRAFSAADAQTIAVEVLSESASLVERLSEIAQADSTEFARLELVRSQTRLQDARATLTAFRSRTQIVDPNADLQGRMGLLATLQQELATTLINADMLRKTTRSSDIRLDQADARISVIEARIADERQKIGAGGTTGTEDYAGVVSEFERLSADRAFAEQSYSLALAAYDAALADARRKSRYLAVHVSPTLAQSPQYPAKLKLFATAAFFLCAAWSAAALVYYSLRDRR